MTEGIEKKKKKKTQIYATTGHTLAQSRVMGKDIHTSRKREEVDFSYQTKETLGKKWLGDKKKPLYKGSIHP